MFSKWTFKSCMLLLQLQPQTQQFLVGSLHGWSSSGIIQTKNDRMYFFDRKCGFAWKSNSVIPPQRNVCTFWSCLQCYRWKPWIWLWCWIMLCHYYTDQPLVESGPAGVLHHQLHQHHQQTRLLCRQDQWSRDSCRQLFKRQWFFKPSVSERNDLIGNSGFLSDIV